MESQDETARLIAQALADSARQRLVAAGMRGGMSVLDVGCGPGVVTREIGTLVGVDGCVTGVDISRERLTMARDSCGDIQNSHFHYGSVYDLPFPPSSFDFVWSQYLFQ